ncbi:MAG: XRE family transcriptional regulator [Gemmatimonadetes bacterium]|jgi:predicted XRE-type DNA-binding protein|nr:XRE family transcriptional regulator [Gemmatimonadota bacterium]
MKNPHIGSTFESFLQKEGIREEVDVLAQKRVLAWQIEQAMEEIGMTKVELAARMKTSRTQVERLLDPDNNKVQLDTLQRAAKAVGRTLKVELV